MISDASSWMVDPDRLRLFLDKLHAALAASPVLPPPFRLDLEGSDALLPLLTDLCDRVAAHKPGLSSVAAGLGVPREEQVAPLQALLRSLNTAWRRRFLMKLGPAKAQRIRDLLAHPVPDLLSLLHKHRMENAYSDVISWLLDPRSAPCIAPACLRALAERLDDAGPVKAALEAALAGRTLSVRREMTIGRDWDGSESLDRLDLVVTGPDLVVVIENKVHAREHVDQTRRYWKWLTQQRGATAAFYLTPSGETASAPGFTPIAYPDFVACLMEGPVRSGISAEEEVVLSVYLKVLAAHSMRSEMRALAEVI